MSDLRTVWPKLQDWQRDFLVAQGLGWEVHEKTGAKQAPILFPRGTGVGARWRVLEWKDAGRLTEDSAGAWLPRCPRLMSATTSRQRSSTRWMACTHSSIRVS